MGFYVHLHVCFAADRNDGVAEVAEQHLAAIAHTEAIEARWFLESLASRTGENFGPKGGLSLWGIVGNRTDPLAFAEALRPFWEDLLSGLIDGGPCRHERVIVTYQPEQSEAAGVIEIGWDNPIPPTHPQGSPDPHTVFEASRVTALLVPANVTGTPTRRCRPTASTPSPPRPAA